MVNYSLAERTTLSMIYGLLKQAEKDPCQFLVTYRSTGVSLAELMFKQTSFDSPWSDMMA